MARIVPLLAFGLALLVTAPVAAAALTPLPAAFRGNDVFLQVAVNGAAPVWMKLDIARTQSALSQRSAYGSTARESLQIGAAKFADVAFGAQASETCTGPDGAPLAGVLAADFLGDRPLWIDTLHKKVWLSPPVPDDVPAPSDVQTASYIAR